MARRDDLTDVGRAVVREPRLWPTVVVAGVRHRPGRWWRGRAAVSEVEPWLRFRLETAYGAERSTPTPDDVVTYLRWLKQWRSERG